MMFENELGIVHCDSDVQTVDRIVGAYGLRATLGNEPHKFRIVSGGRAMLQDAVVEEDLLSLALESLNRAKSQGIIPSFTLVAV